MDIQPQFLTIQTNTESLSSQSLKQTLPKSQNVHIIPAYITTSQQQHYNAEVSAYFDANINILPNQYENSLLGHALKGQDRKCENLYECYLSKESNASIYALKKVEEMIEWRKDQRWGQNQGRIATIRKYQEIQDALHGSSA